MATITPHAAQFFTLTFGWCVTILIGLSAVLLIYSGNDLNDLRIRTFFERVLIAAIVSGAGMIVFGSASWLTTTRLGGNL